MAYADLLAALKDAPEGIAVDGLASEPIDEAVDAGLVSVFSSWTVDYVRLTDDGRRTVGLPVVRQSWLSRLFG